MSEKPETIALKKAIFSEWSKQGVFGCFEVTIGWAGKERVDFMTMDTKGVFRFFEIKVSVSDFNSKCHNTFLGKFNYYVLTQKVYEKVKAKIPADIGVYVGSENLNCVTLVKRPKARQVTLEQALVNKDSLLRSLSRDASKFVNSQMFDERSKLTTQISRLNKENRELLQQSRNYSFEHSELRHEIRTLTRKLALYEDNNTSKVKFVIQLKNSEGFKFIAGTDLFWGLILESDYTKAKTLESIQDVNNFIDFYEIKGRAYKAGFDELLIFQITESFQQQHSIKI